MSIHKFFGNHPLLGLGASFGSFFSSLMLNMEDFLQFSTLIIGILVGLLTAWGKILEIRKKLKE